MERDPARSDPSAISGYGSPVRNDSFVLGIEEKKALLQLARHSLESYLRAGRVIDPPANLAATYPHLDIPRACFVTLRKQGELRGCIGSLEPRRSLIDDVRHNAVSAGVHDSRFRPVQADELAQLDVEISVLDLPRVIEGVSPDQLPTYLARHRPGLIIEYQGRRSTFLPTVWEDLRDPLDFLGRLCRKQGSPATCWRDASARISEYGSVHFSEKDLD